MRNPDYVMESDSVSYNMNTEIASFHTLSYIWSSGRQGARPFPVYSMKESLPPADLVVVTPTYAYQAIAAQLTSRTDNPIVSAEDLVKEWYDDAEKG